MKRVVLTASSLVIFLAIIAGAYYLGTQRVADTSSHPQAASAEREVLYWYDPMQPAQHFDKPGKSPFMDMALQPKYADEAGPAGVRVDSATRQNLGVRTQRVELGRLARGLHVQGAVTWDRRLAYAVSARADAVVDKLYVRAPFEPVAAGQPLAELLAPQWSSAIAEYQALADARSSAGAGLRDAAHQRLRVLGLSEADIRALGSRGSSGQRIMLRAPANGVVAELDVREGQRVAAGAALMGLNGLDTVWIEAAIPQSDSAGIERDTPAKVLVAALPGETFDGRVEALLPEVDTTTRTQRARVVVDNREHRLVPGMFAELQIDGTAGDAHPLLPEEALIATGDDTRVIVADDDGQFRPVRVRTGRAAGGRIEILDGLEGGERVVTSGQFLLDSEASMSGALQRLQNDASDDSHAEHKP